MLIATLFLYIYFNEAKIVAYIIEDINKKIDTKISASAIDVSLFKSFPNVSLSFSKLKIESSKSYLKNQPAKPELLSANKLHIHFNLYHFLQKNFKVSGISAEGGYVNILIEKNGRKNYNFLKEPDESHPQEIKLELNHIELENMFLNYVDQQQNFYTTGYVMFVKLEGVVNATQIDGFINLAIKDLDVNKSIKLKDKLLFKSSISFKKSDLRLENISLNHKNSNINGAFFYNEKKYSAQVKTNFIEVEELITYLNKYIPKEVNLHEGRISVEGVLNGSKIETVTSANFKVTLSDLRSNCLKIKNFMLDGFFVVHKNAHNINIKTSNLDFKYKNSNFSLSGSYNLNKTDEFNLLAQGEVTLNDINDFVDSSEYNILTGKAGIKIGLSNLNPLMGNKDITIADFKIAAEGELDGFSGAFYSKAYRLNDAQCKFSYTDDNLSLLKASGKLNSTFFNSTLYVNNLISYTTGKKDLFIKGDIKCDSVIPIHFIAHKRNTASDEQTTAVNGDVQLEFGQLEYEKIYAKEFRCRLQFSDKKYLFFNLNTKFYKGSIFNSEAIINLENRMHIQSKLQFKEIEIRELFRTFDNFGQTQLKAENINGKLNGSCESLLTWDEQNKLIVADMKVSANFEIVNGTLNNFKPVEKLANYLEINDINNIKFKNIKNTISISNNMLFIPEMEIQSSAINLNISGQHSFSNDYEYHFNMLIADILIPKKKNKKQDYEFGVVQEEHKNRSRLYLKLTGKDDKFKFSYDNKKAMEAFSGKMYDEKKKLKSIVKEEFSAKMDSIYPIANKKQPAIENNEFVPETKKIVTPQKNRNTAAIEWKDE